MYQRYFGLSKKPFSIVPDTQFLYLSRSHREAIAHLAYAISDKNGFIQLTGEVGLGKTMVCRYLLSKMPENIDVALITNPKMSEAGLLKTLCKELKIAHRRDDDTRELTEKITRKLLKTHSKDRHTILIVDEAQNLPKATLEQVRLLTNLETDNQKLLRIILIGQPELADWLSHYDMRQVAQRITSRYTFSALTQIETNEYIKHRLAVAGSSNPIFTSGALKKVHTLTKGTPRLINLLCDRSLMGAFSLGVAQINTAIVNKAAKEALPKVSQKTNWSIKYLWGLLLLALLLGGFSLRNKWNPYVTEWLDETANPLLNIFTSSDKSVSHLQSGAPELHEQPLITEIEPKIKSTIEKLADRDFRLGIPGKEPGAIENSN